MIKQGYLCQFSKCERNQDTRSWAGKVKSLLHIYGFGHVWETQQVGDIAAFMSIFKQRLVDISLQTRHTIIEDNYPTHYSLYVENYTPSYILKPYFAINDRRIITLLRTMSLPIRNNLHRMNIVECNLCRKCFMNAIEDERHFLFECAYYNSIRVSKDHLVNSLHEAKFDYGEALNTVLTSEATKNLLQIIKYIKESGILSDRISD